MAETDQPDPSLGNPTSVQPGSVITPGGQPSQPTPEPPSPTAAEIPEPAAAPEASPYVETNDQPDAEVAMDGINSSEISWIADEFMSHEKSPTWYLGLLVAGAVIAFIVYWTTKDVVSTSVVILATIVLGVVGARRPKQINYTVTNRGINVENRFYDYAGYHSFSTVPEGHLTSILLLPLKRFSLPLTLYCRPEDENRIVQVIAERLPMEERKVDVIDSLMRRIHF